MDYPEILSQNAGDHSVLLELDIKPALDAFEGHFDQFPIVPGVVQIGWSLHFLINCWRPTLTQEKEQSSTRFQH